MPLHAQQLAYTAADSLWVTRTIAALCAERMDSLEDSIPVAPEILDVADCLLGVPYVAGTLDRYADERLVLNTQELDCTTFVELTLALWLTVQCDIPSFNLLCHHLGLLRYREGSIDGYLSRLHYFSDWVEENTRRGVWRELLPDVADSHLWVADTFALSFMSEHPQSYPYLAEHTWAVDSMRSIEARYAHYPVRYIDKSFLHLPPEELPIRNGDILALVTTIDGLDVTHLGFAVWKGDELHLMHASMNYGKVAIDERRLYDYLASRKSCPGVRVIRYVSTVP